MNLLRKCLTFVVSNCLVFFWDLVRLLRENKAPEVVLPSQNANSTAPPYTECAPKYHHWWRLKRLVVLYVLKIVWRNQELTLGSGILEKILGNDTGGGYWVAIRSSGIAGCWNLARTIFGTFPDEFDQSFLSTSIFGYHTGLIFVKFCKIFVKFVCIFVGRLQNTISRDSLL